MSTESAPAAAAAPNTTPDATPKLPATVICVGMAGSGKTTFMQRLNAHLHAASSPPYIINLDPAVHSVPFDCNIDIRDSVNYKEVMSQYHLGPNGGIMTSLNLFATKIDQVINILEKRASTLSRVLVDTPGQIECFVWSASGAIITDAIASAVPTVVAYVIDTPRTAQPATFMANMLYACSILYKTKLPMILVFNKTDAHSADFAKEWMTDFEAFQAALRATEDGNEEGVGGSGYMASLLNSMSLMLDEFYNHLDLVAVSSMTGAGVDDFLAAVDKKVEEYNREYKPEMEKARQRREEEKLKAKQAEVDRLMRDMELSGDAGKGKGKEEPAVLSDVETDDDWDSDEDYVAPAADDNGLQARYADALAEKTSEKQREDEESLRRYLAANG